MRKTVELKVKLVIDFDEKTEKIEDIINELGYDFWDQAGVVNIKDMEILDYEVKNSK